MPTCTSCRTASPSPINRVALIASLAILAAAALVVWQPSGPLQAAAVDSAARAMTVAALHTQAT